MFTVKKICQKRLIICPDFFLHIRFQAVTKLPVTHRDYIHISVTGLIIVPGRPFLHGLLLDFLKYLRHLPDTVRTFSIIVFLPQ